MYSKLIGATSPGLIIILVDQSGSMGASYGSSTRAEFAALAVNRTIYEIVASCRKGEKISDRCTVTVIGYGKSVSAVVAGSPSQIANPPHGTQTLKKQGSDGAGGLVEVDWNLGVWVKPEADNGTPMAEAMNLAADLAEAWTRDKPDNFPPIFINITDGEPNDWNSGAAPDTRAAAQRIARLSTNDGAALLYNCHIGTGTQENKLPTSAASLPDDFARLLFDISSVIPEQLLPLARNSGLMAEQGSRGIIINASPEALTRLLVFGSGSMKS